jgi:hypothetical protein
MCENIHRSSLVADGLVVVVHNTGHLHLPQLSPLGFLSVGSHESFLCVRKILGTRYSSLHNILYAETRAQRNSNKLMLNTHSIYNVPLCVLRLRVVIFNTYCKFVNKKLINYLFAYSYKKCSFTFSLSSAASGYVPVYAGLPCNEGTR